MADIDVFAQAYNVTKQIIDALDIPNFSVFPDNDFNELYPCAIITQPEDQEEDYYSGINQYTLGWTVRVLTKDLNSITDGLYKQTDNKGASKLATEIRRAILDNRDLYTGLNNIVGFQIVRADTDAEIQGWEMNLRGLYDIPGGTC